MNFKKIGELQYDLLVKKLSKVESLLKEQNLLKKEILDLGEACLYLKISDSMLYKLTSKGDIPYFKPNGKKLYFKRSELDEWRTQEPSISNEHLKKNAKIWLKNSLNSKTV